MTLEEVMIKVGVDTSQVEPKLLQASVVAENTGKRATRSFLTAGEATEKWKTVLNQISMQIPGLGQAIQFAFNPVIGILGAMAAGTLAVKNRIDDLNKASDAAEARNAKPITNRESIRRAVIESAGAVYDAARTHDLENASTRHDLKVSTGADSNVDRNKQLGVLSKQNFLLMVEASGRLIARNRALRDAAGVDRKSMLEKAKQVLADAQSNVDRLKSEMPQLRRAAVEEDISNEGVPFEEGLKFVPGIGMVGSKRDAATGKASQANKKFSEATDSLKRYETAMKDAEETIRKLNLEDKEAARILKEKQAAYDDASKKWQQVREEIKKTARELNIQHNVDLNRIFTARDLDPETGGVRFKGIGYRGLSYRAIGERGINAPVQPVPKKNLDELLEILNAKMDELVKAAKNDGMIVKAKES